MIRDRNNGNGIVVCRRDQNLFRKCIAELHVSAFQEKPVSQSGHLDGITEAFKDSSAASKRDLPMDIAAQSLNVLVAEDIPVSQKVVTAILSRRGDESTIAKIGHEAIDPFERQDFDLILMDVQMPIQDGMQATQVIRDIEKNSGRRIPIIAMTAHAMPGDGESCMTAGMDYYQSEPRDAQLLLRTIEHLRQPRVSSRELLNSIITQSGFWRLKQEKPGSRSLSAKGEARVTEKTKPLELWKPEVALRRMGDDTELLLSMVGYFQEDSPKLLVELQQLIEDDDSTEAARAAHSLKGLCSNFEAVQATQAALELETKCMAGKLAEAENLLPTLSETLANLSLELTIWQNQHVNAGLP